MDNSIFFESVKKYGTPQYLYDFPAIKERIKTVKNILPTSVKLYYAVKANPNLKLLQYLKPLVDGLDVSSGGELKQSHLAGYNFANINFAGPGKTEAELEYAINHDIGSISVESASDIARIEHIAAKVKKKVGILMRINPFRAVGKFAMKMGGIATQFGVNEEDLELVIKAVIESHYVQLLGFHVYSGTQCLDAPSLLENYSYTLQLTEKLVKTLKLTVSRINIGGGFGVPYFADNQPLNLNVLDDALPELLNNFEKTIGQKPEYILELGRYLIAEAGYYLTRIINKKNSKGITYYILDGGMHHNLAAAGYLGQIIKKNYLIKNVSRPNEKLHKVNLSGPLCTPLDTMAQGLELPVSELEDVIVFFNSGAYGFSSSPLLFLSHETPPEVLYKDGKFELIRRSFDVTKFND